MNDLLEKPTKKPARHLPAFIVQLGDDYGRRFHVPIIDLNLQGTFSLSRMQLRKDPQGKHLGGRDVGSAMSNMPERPGHHLALDFVAGTASTHDPLTEDPDRLKRGANVLKRTRAASADVEYGPFEDTKADLDTDSMKTLCRWVLDAIDNKQAIVISGTAPSREQIANLPGRFLYDPANDSTGHFRPKYEDQQADWNTQQDRV